MQPHMRYTELDLAESMPAQSLWAAAAVRESFRPEDLLADWLRTHPQASAQDTLAATQTALALEDVGEPAFDVQGAGSFRLPLSERLKVLREIGRQGAIAALRLVPSDSRTCKEITFDALLRGDTVELDEGDRSQLVALDTVSDWVEAAGVNIPYEREKVRKYIARSDFLRTMGGDDLYRFIGRRDLLEQLEEAWNDPPRRARTILVEGPGGIGKSLAITRFIASLLEKGGSSAPHAVFHIDFDRRSLQGARPATIIEEILRQASQWIHDPTASAQLQNLRRGLSSPSVDALEAPMYVSRSRESLRDNMEVISSLVDLLRDSKNRRENPRLLIFVDSFEQVEQYDNRAAQSPVEAIRMLADTGAKVLAIFASRSFAQPGKLDASGTIRLTGFAANESHQYLRNESLRVGLDISTKVIRHVIESVGSSPLALRLAVAVLEKDSGGFNPVDWADLARRSADFVQATLYERFLQRMRDPELRKIAYPGLLVRRLTEGIITTVLAEPCSLDLSTITASSLMEKARREGQLFIQDPADPEAIIHRADVRRCMIAGLDSAIPSETARRINELAVTYYTERDGNTLHKTEELYHRLRLGQQDKVLEECWDEVAGYALRPCITEFPPAGQAFLRAKLGSALLTEKEEPSGSLASLVDSIGQLFTSAASFLGFLSDEAIWKKLPNSFQEIGLAALKMLQSGRAAAEVAKILSRARLNKLDSPLGAIYAQVLLRQGYTSELFRQARALGEKKRAILSGEVLANIFATVAAAMEGQKNLLEAQQYWDRALSEAGTTSDDLLQLACLIGWCRVQRKDQKLHELAGHEERMRDRALNMLDKCFPMVIERRVLAREAAAEFADMLSDAHSKTAKRYARMVRRLLEDVLKRNEAFPSSEDDSERRLELLSRFAEHWKNDSQGELHDIVARLLYSDFPPIDRLVNSLREEVEWTLRQAIGSEAPGRQKVNAQRTRPVGSASTQTQLVQSTSDWLQLRDQAEQFEAQGKFTEAENAYKRLLRQAQSVGNDVDSALAASKLADMMQVQGHLDDAVALRTEVELPVYQRLGDLRAIAVTTGQLADILMTRGELDKAMRIRKEEELPMYERLGDVRSKAVTQGRIAEILFRKGELDEAMRIIQEEQLPVFKRLGDVRSVAVTQGQIANISQARGKLDEALRIRQEEQLPVFNRLGDVRGIAVCRGKIADILETRGELDEALRIRQEEQLPVFKRLGDVREIAVCMGKIADILETRGELDEALRIRQEEQLPVFKRLGDMLSVAVTQGNIADILETRGELDEALRIRQEEQLPVFKRLGDVHSVAVTQGQIANILESRGELDEALRIRQEEELPVYEHLGDVRSVAVTQGQIADILVTRGELGEALRIRQEEELPVYEHLGDVRSVAVTQGQIANIHLSRSEFEEAFALQQQRLHTNEQLQDQDGIAATLWDMGRIALRQGRMDEAVGKIHSAYALMEKLGRLDGIATIGLSYGQLLALSGKHKEGLAVLRRSADGFRKLKLEDSAAQAERLIQEVYSTNTEGNLK